MMSAQIKKGFIFIGLLSVLLFGANAQISIPLTQYQEVMPLYNPAFAGIENHTDFRFGVRRQWVGMEDAPFATYAHVSGVLPDWSPNKRRKVRYKSPYDIGKMADNVNVPNNGLRSSNPYLLRRMVEDSIRQTVRKLDRKARTKLRRQLQPSSGLTHQPKHGYSFSLIGDEQAAITKYSLSGGYAVHLPVSREMMMSVGVSGLVNSAQFDRNKATVLNPANDQLYQQYASGDLNKYSYYINTGLSLYSSDFYASYSIVKILGAGLGSGQAFGLEGVDTQHNLAGGVYINVGNSFLLSPGILFSYKSQSPFALYVTSKIYYQEKLWLGINFRNRDAFGGSIGFYFSDRYKLSYAYDVPISKPGNAFGSTHEVVFGILLARGSAPKPVIR